MIIKPVRIRSLSSVVSAPSGASSASCNGPDLNFGANNPSLLAATLAVFIALRLHSLHRLHGPTPLLSHVWGYLVWAVMQQFLLQSYFLLRLLGLLPGKAAPIVAAAGMFSLAHLPNPIPGRPDAAIDRSPAALLA